MTDIDREADLSVGTVFSAAWKTFRQHWGGAIGVFVIFCLFNVLGSGTETGVDDAIAFILGGAIYAGTYKYYVDLLRGNAPRVVQVFDAFRSGRRFVRAFAVYFLYSLMVLIGLILLVIPGIYIAIAFLPAMYLVLDEEQGILDTLNKAWDMTEGRRGEIFLVMLAVILLVIAGLLVLGIGLLVAGPLAMLMGAAVYDRLAAEQGQAVPGPDSVTP